MCHQLRQRVELAQHGVDLRDDLGFGQRPDGAQPASQRTYARELPLVARPRTGPSPGLDKGVECCHVAEPIAVQLVGVQQGSRARQRKLGVMGKKHLTSFASLRSLP